MTDSIIYRNAIELKTWDRNYRKGDVGAIITSIDTFGFNGALRLWQDDTVVAGNHALIALRQMKDGAYKTPHHIVERDGAWFVPCIDVSHLSKLQAEAFATADNRTQERGTNDAQQLAELLSNLAAEEENLLLATGYDEDEFDALLRHLSIANDDEWAGAFDGLPDGDRSPFQQMTFTLHDEQVEQVKAAINASKALGPFDSPNENSNGNALARICEIFVTDHGQS